MPQREALYTLGNQLAKADQDGVEGFEKFRYIDNTCVSKMEKVGDKIHVSLKDLDTREPQVRINNAVYVDVIAPDTRWLLLTM